MDASVGAEVEAEFLMKILTGLIKKAAAPILGGPFLVCCGAENQDGKCVAHSTDPVISYISTHKTKPKISHKELR